MQGGGLTQKQQRGGFLVEARQQSRRLGLVDCVGSKALGGQQLGSQQALKAQGPPLRPQGRHQVGWGTCVRILFRQGGPREADPSGGRTGHHQGHPFA